MMQVLVLLHRALLSSPDLNAVGSNPIDIPLASAACLAATWKTTRPLARSDSVTAKDRGEDGHNEQMC